MATHSGPSPGSEDTSERQNVPPDSCEQLLASPIRLESNTEDHQSDDSSATQVSSQNECVEELPPGKSSRESDDFSDYSSDDSSGEKRRERNRQVTIIIEGFAKLVREKQYYTLAKIFASVIFLLPFHLIFEIVKAILIRIGMLDRSRKFTKKN